MGGSLTPEQIAQYNEYGYVVVPEVLSEDAIRMYKDRASEIAHGDYPEEAKSRIMWDVRIRKGLIPMPEDKEKGLWKFMNPDRFDETFARYMETPKLLDAVESLIGEDIIAFLLMLIYKPPHVDAVHPYHQDAWYFPFGPHDLCIGTWLPLDDATADNGTLRVIPGSHKKGLMEHKMPETLTNAFSFECPGYDDDPTEQVLDVKAGDAVLFHSLLLHKTGGNSTDGHRRVLTIHGCSAKCKWVGDAKVPEFGMRLVRGQNYEGCIQAPEELSLEYMKTAESDITGV